MDGRRNGWMYVWVDTRWMDGRSILLELLFRGCYVSRWHCYCRFYSGQYVLSSCYWCGFAATLIDDEIVLLPTMLTSTKLMLRRLFLSQSFSLR